MKEVQAANLHFESSIKKDRELVRSDIRTELRDQKVDISKWFVGLFVTLALIIIGRYIRK